MASTLQKRLSAILGLALTVSGLTSYLILKTVIAPAFNTLESSVAKTDLDRAALGIDGQVQQIKAIVGDWAPWDQVNDYAVGKDPDFVDRNINQATLLNLDVDLMQLYDRDRERLWGAFLVQGEYAAIETLDRFGEADPVNDTLTSHTHPDSVVAGTLMTARGPMILVSMPLLDEAGIFPINGTIMMGRVLSEERLQSLRDHIKVSFDILPLAEVREKHPAVLEKIEAATTDDIVQSVEGSQIYTYRVLADISGQPLAVLQAQTRRDVTSLGENAADVALLLFVVTSLLLLGFLWVLLRMDIVRPLGKLAAHMGGIRRSGELSARLTPTRDDEIGRLATEFNSLTAELQEARRQLVDQSFKAGKADTAAEVLHNIRNAMTPVVDVAENLSATLEEITSLRFRRAADELASEGCDDERRSDLLRYIAAAADRTNEMGTRGIHDLAMICQQARLVEEILAGQEKATRAVPLRQHLNLADVVREACNVVPRHATVELRIAPELGDMAVTGIRVQLLQIVGNMVLNAYESIQRAGNESGCIEIFAIEKTIGDIEMVELSIRDNGNGIEQSQLTRIFQRGYTSKQGAGSGLGLHWCANAVGALGGAVRVESPGPGKGATACIALPAAQAATTDEDGVSERAPVRGQA